MEAVLPSAIQHLLDYFAHNASDEEILAYGLSDSEQERVRDLLERAAHDDVLPSERAELDQLTVLDEEISLLKARARKRLAGK